METMLASAKGIDTIIQGVSAANEYRISSVEFHRFLDEHNKKIETGLAELEKREAGHRKNALKGATDIPMRQLPQSTVTIVENI